MSWAKVGAKCVCIDGKIWHNVTDMEGYSLNQVYPTEGNVYTIAWVGEYEWASGEQGIGVHLVEFNRACCRRTGIVHPLSITRFLPIVSKTIEDDIALFKRIADTAPSLEEAQ